MNIKEAVVAYHEQPDELAKFLASKSPHVVVQFMAELVGSGHNPTELELMDLTMRVLHHQS